MKKTEKKSKVTHSKTPPRGYPSKAELEKMDKLLEKAHGSQGLSPNANPVDRIKYDLCAQFVRYSREHQTTQRELAKILGVNEARVSEIVRYRHQRFTIDKLVELLSVIKPNLKVKVA